MPGDAEFTVTMNPEAKAQMALAVFQSVQEIFELDIKPAAVESSPVDTGANRRSIDTEVIQIADGVQAELYSQSGYGGYLETGTRKMKAQPYMWPALLRFMDKLTSVVRGKISVAEKWEPK